MKCKYCGKQFATSKDERDGLRNAGFYSPAWYVRDQGYDANRMKDLGIDPDDWDNMLCPDCLDKVLDTREVSMKKIESNRYGGPYKYVTLPQDLEMQSYEVKEPEKFWDNPELEVTREDMVNPEAFDRANMLSNILAKYGFSHMYDGDAESGPRAPEETGFQVLTPDEFEKMLKENNLSEDDFEVYDFDPIYETPDKEDWEPAFNSCGKKKKDKKPVKSSVDSVVKKLEEYFGTVAEGNTVSAQGIITELDKKEIEELVGDARVQIGQYSVTVREPIESSRKINRSITSSVRDSIDDIVMNNSTWSGSNMASACKTCAKELEANGYSKAEVKQYFDNEGYYDEATGNGVWDKEFTDCVLNYLTNSFKNNSITSKRWNHSITSAVRDSVDNFSVNYKDVWFNFTRTDNGWVVSDVDASSAADNNWGVSEGVVYSADELRDLFGYLPDIGSDKNLVIEEDNFELMFDSSDEPEFEEDSDFEYDNYRCSGVRYSDSENAWFEGEELTNEEMKNIVEEIENETGKFSEMFLNKNVSPEDVL